MLNLYTSQVSITVIHDSEFFDHSDFSQAQATQERYADEVRRRFGRTFQMNFRDAGVGKVDGELTLALESYEKLVAQKYHAGAARTAFGAAEEALRPVFVHER